MANPLIIAGRIAQKRKELNALKEEIETINKRSEDLESAITEAESEEDLNVLEIQVDEVDSEKQKKLDEKATLEEELSNLEKELEENNKKEPKAEGEKHMNNKVELTEQREAIETYIRSLGMEKREKFTTVEGGALIPKELAKPKMEEPYEQLNLLPFVEVVKVKRGAGTYPIIHRATGVMVSVEELAENPELNVSRFTQTDYKIDTYRGEIPISQEMIEDADYDVVGLIADSIEIQELNTKNTQIAKALKGMTPKAVTGADGLKKMKNVDIKQAYNAGARWIVSASMFNELDTLKDNEGRYLLQQDIKAESGKSLFGKPVEILDDDVIGTNVGDLVGFYGNSKNAITLFDRKQASAEWVSHHTHARVLAMFSRFQVKVTDVNAGFYFTYTPEVAGA